MEYNVGVDDHQSSARSANQDYHGVNASNDGIILKFNFKMNEKMNANLKKCDSKQLPADYNDSSSNFLNSTVHAENLSADYNYFPAICLNSTVHAEDLPADYNDSSSNFLNSTVHAEELHADYNYFPANCLNSTAEVEPSGRTTSILLEEQVTASFWDKSLDSDLNLGGLSCNQILSLAHDTIGSQKSQSGFYVQQPATPLQVLEEKGKVKEKDGVPISEQKRKKQKNGTYLNKKPGEKRQNKYYWPKIDKQKKPTPKPKTPKPMTPKPKRTYPKKKKDIPSKQVSKKAKKVDESCKRSLNFKDGKVASIGLDLNLDALCYNWSGQEAKQIEEQALDERIAQKHVKTYYRRRGSKCLNNCRTLGLNFSEAFKKRRLPRAPKSTMGLKIFKGFSRFSIDLDLCNRITVVRAKKRMILPNKEENVEGLFPCVMRLLSSPTRMRTKRRSSNRVPRIKANSTEDGNLTELCVDKDLMNPKNQMVPSNLSNASLCSSYKKGSKAEAANRKRGRSNKKKAKKLDYLGGEIYDWGKSSMEKIMDPFVQHFESMELYDNPKTLERWSVLKHERVNNEDGEETYEEKIKWEEDRQRLLERIAKFIYVMTVSQGRRDFIKWKGSVLDSVIGVFLTQNVSDVLSSNAYIELGSRFPLTTTNEKEKVIEDSEIESSQGSSSTMCTPTNVLIEQPEEEEELRSKDYDAALNEMLDYLDGSKGKGKESKEKSKIDWEPIRARYVGEDYMHYRNPNHRDSIDWEAVRKAPVLDIANAIKERGQHIIIAGKIKKTLNRLLDKHGTLDLEWLRQAPHQVAKAYLLSFYGLGLKSVECVRLLTLYHHGFPVDVNIARVAIRLGWVPLVPLPVGMYFHHLERYPLETEIQKALWEKLKHLDQKTLYKLHCHMITFGKVFCAKKKPNCAACPFKAECLYYASLVSSQAHSSITYEKGSMKSKKARKLSIRNPFDLRRDSSNRLSLTSSTLNSCSEVSRSCYLNYPRSQKPCDPIIEMPPSPEPESEPFKPEVPEVVDIEDLCMDTKDQIILEIKLNINENFESEKCDYDYFEERNRVVIGNGNEEAFKAIVSVSSEDAFRPLSKHMLIARLRTEHQVYELPDFHPLLNEVDRREEKDFLPYMLAVWTPGQMKKNVESSEQSNNPSISDENAEEESLTVPGTLLIPSRTAMKGFFPLNGTYFQVNEVFADDESSQRPIDVPRKWLWNLPRRTLYCGSGITSIFRGLTWSEIQRCCCQGFICTRAFDRKNRAPKKLHSRLHLKSKSQEDED